MNRQLRTVAIESLRLPGDWRARLEGHSVREMVASGPIRQPPAIVKATREVIFGGDRLAAMHLRGEAEAECWVYDDLTDDDIAEMRLVENIYRRHDNRDFHLAQLVALREKRILAGEEPASLEGMTREAITGQADHPAPDAPEAGRPKTPRGLAREQVAAAAGITTEAVRSAEKRAAEREKHDDGPEVGTRGATGGNAGGAAAENDGPSASPPATPGLAESVALDELDRLLMAAVKAVTRLAKDYPALVERFPVQDLKWKLQREVAPGFRAMRPQDRCPFCKCWPSELPNCGACKGSGWIVADQLNDIPKELLATGKDEGIYVGGTFRTLKELAEAGTKKLRKLQTPVKPAKRGKEHWDEASGTILPTERATRAVLEDDFSDAWTGDEK